MKFERSLYYSQTEVIKKYKLTIKQFKALLLEKNIPQVNKKISLGEYNVTTIYVLKEDIDKLNLALRVK